MTQNCIELHLKKSQTRRNSNLFPIDDYNFFDAHKFAITETIDMMVRDILYWAKKNFNKELNREFKIASEKREQRWNVFVEVGEKFTR
jgi:hypothetical protein